MRLCSKRTRSGLVSGLKFLSQRYGYYASLGMAVAPRRIRICEGARPEKGTDSSRSAFRIAWGERV